MSYQFQVDLLDDGVLDYSGQQLSMLNENSLPAGLTTTDGSALAYSTTKWYSPVPPGGVGTPAKSHCDGTPLSPTTDPDPTMYLVEGAANPITPASAWVSGSDVNFDGTISAAFRGYDDWANLDLRQIGATGSEIFGGGKLTVGTGKLTVGTGKLTVGTGKLTVGAGKLTVGTGVGELTFETANSSVRSPRSLTATQTTPPRYIQLNWLAPTFGQIGSYNIYRSTNGATAVLVSSVLGSSLTFTDTAVTCGPTYSYFVTAVLANTNPPHDRNFFGEPVDFRTVSYLHRDGGQHLRGHEHTNRLGSVLRGWRAIRRSGATVWIGNCGHGNRNPDCQRFATHHQRCIHEHRRRLQRKLWDSQPDSQPRSHLHDRDLLGEPVDLRAVGYVHRDGGEHRWGRNQHSHTNRFRSVLC
jgi:X-X-X-Leu-X-X-Gly heptad repeat protein